MKVQQPPKSPGFARVLRPRYQSPTSTVVDLWSTTAGRRIHTHRADRRRAVFVYRAPSADRAEEAPSDHGQRSAVGARLCRLRAHQPFSPVGGTAIRPVTDAVNTFTILREILRGNR